MAFYPTLEDHPFWYVYGFLLVVVFCRAQATYWVGRGALAGTLRTRLAKHIEGPQMTRARRALDRWGAPAITVSFLTIGFQTVINACAGFLRMNYLRYTLAMLPGCLAWALVYTVGAAAVVAWIELAVGSPWLAAVVAALVIAVGTGIWLWRRSRRGAAAKIAVPDETEQAETAGQPR